MTRAFPNWDQRAFPVPLETTRFPSGGNPYFNPEADQNFSSVVLLLHLDGSDNDTTTSDNSDSNHTISFVGNAKLDDGIKKFGGTSLILDSTDDYISAPDSEDWHMGTGEFTIECFVRHSVTPASGTTSWITQWNSSDALQSFAFFLSSNTMFFRFRTSSGAIRDTSAAWTPSVGVWYHIAVDRDSSGVVRIYVDGVVFDTQTFTDNFRNSTKVLRIGSTEGFSSLQFEGNIDEVRITKGVYRYGGAFTSPIIPFKDI